MLGGKMKNKNLKKAIFIVLFGLIFLMLNSNESKATDEYTFHFDQVTYKYSEVNEILTEINNMKLIVSPKLSQKLLLLLIHFSFYSSFIATSS